MRSGVHNEDDDQKPGEPGIPGKVASCQKRGWVGTAAPGASREGGGGGTEPESGVLRKSAKWEKVKKGKYSDKVKERKKSSLLVGKRLYKYIKESRK